MKCFSEAEKIGLASHISKLLGMEDNSLIKLTKIYAQKLEEDLKPLQKRIDDLPLNYKGCDLESYDFIFFKIFIDIIIFLIPSQIR